MKFAKKLQELYKKEKNYILLSDFNSPLIQNKKAWGSEVALVSKDNYNLWYDVPKNSRYSYKFYKIKNAIDHIIVSKSLEKMYLEGSFKVRNFSYLTDKYGNAKRWKISKKGKGKHLGIGYSDHFAISAAFITKQDKNVEPKKVSIKELLDREGRVNYLLEDVIVIYKNKYGITIEDKNRDKIYIFKPIFMRKNSLKYSLHVKELAIYKGKKEIVLLDFNSYFDTIND